MWDIVVIKKYGEFYTVMTPNGDVDYISEETFKTFEKNNRVKYESKDKKTQ
jgi:hypothetical protein